MDATERTLRARVAAATRWAKEPDRTKATAPARAALEARFEREVDPEMKLAPDERRKRAASARTAHYARMALKRHQARKRAA